MNAPYARDHSRSRLNPAMHTPAGERREFEKRRALVDDQSDPLARKKLPSLSMAGDLSIPSPVDNERLTLTQRRKPLTTGRKITREGFRTRIDS
jgi:hypothetical protein